MQPSSASHPFRSGRMRAHLHDAGALMLAANVMFSMLITAQLSEIMNFNWNFSTSRLCNRVEKTKIK